MKRRKGADKVLQEEPELYPTVRHIWRWFCQLNATRGGGWGPAPLTFQDLSAWAALMRTEPTPWELEMLLMIDGISLRVDAEKSKAERDAKKGKR